MVKNHGKQARPEVSPHALCDTFGITLVQRKGADLVASASPIDYRTGDRQDSLLVAGQARLYSDVEAEMANWLTDFRTLPTATG